MSRLSDLLIAAGGKIPETVRANRQIRSDEETEKLRRALLEGQISESDLNRQLAQKNLTAKDLENQKALEDAKREREARSKLGETLSSFGSQQRLSGAAKDIQGLEEQAGLAPLATEQSFQPKTMREIAMQTGLPGYAGQEDVEKFAKTYITDPETKTDRNAFNKFGQRKEFDTPEHRTSTLEKLNQMGTQFGLTEQEIEAKKQDIENGLAWDVNEFINERINKKLNIGTKVQEEDALRQARVLTEYSKSQADMLAKADMVKKLGVRGTDPLGNKYTSTQSDDAANAMLMGQAINKVDELAISGYDEAAIDNYILTSIGPGRKVADVFSELSNIKDPKAREYAQAKLSFVISYLRKTSGAAIGQDEYRSENSRFFARPNDPQEVLDQKRNSRIAAFSSIRNSAGNAYDDAINTFKEFNTEKPSPYKTTPPVEQKTVPTTKPAITYKRVNGKLVRQ